MLEHVKNKPVKSCNDGSFLKNFRATDQLELYIFMVLLISQIERSLTTILNRESFKNGL